AVYWTSSTERFRESWPRYFATLRLEPRAAGWMKMWRMTSPVPDSPGPDAQGWVALRVEFDHEEEAGSVVLGLGTRVDVLDPPALRDRVAAEAAAVVERMRASQTLCAVPQLRPDGVPR